MRLQRITTRGEPIILGYKGEGNATQIEFDIPDDWQEGVVHLFVLRMNDKEAYEPEGFYVENGFAYWLVSPADTKVVGRGLATYCAVVDGKIVMSQAFTTVTNPSAGSFDVEVTEADKSVLEAALQTVSQFTARAETGADNAQNAAQEASQAAVYTGENLQQAIAAKNEAVAAKDTAVSAKESAEGSATTAGVKAGEASASASQASGYAATAQGAARSAEEKADDADDSATAAGEAATRAEAAQRKSEAAADIARGAIYEWFTLSVNESTGQLVVTERNR